MHHAEERLGVKAGGTTPDGLFTLEHAECQAACTEAPCLQVNYRHAFRATNADLDTLIDDLRAGNLDGEIPAHGTLARLRQSIPADKAAGVVTPEQVGAPAWFPAKDPS
jgi:NADH-quinone oxidoreductase subunit E